MKTKFFSAVAVTGILLFAACSAPSLEDGSDSIHNKSTAREAAVTNTNPFLNCNCTESPTKVTGSTAASYAAAFAPLVKFDRAAPDYPTSVEDIWASTNPASIVCNGTLQLTNATAPQSLNFPTYYDVQNHPTDADKAFVEYWFVYKRQEPCSAGQGSHDYDLEHIVVQFKKSTSKILTVTYFQHAGWYTKDWRNVAQGTRINAFVGKFAHGMYHFKNTVSFIGYACTYYGDYRNPADASDEASTWNNLQAMSCQKSEFNFNGNWGSPGKGPLYRDRAFWNYPACKGSDGLFGTDGCSQSDFAVGTLLGSIN